MGLRSQLSWLVKGRAATESTLQSLTTDLQALQQKVAAMEAQVSSLSKELPLLRDRQLDEFDKVRASVAATTDDLMARLDALRRAATNRERFHRDSRTTSRPLDSDRRGPRPRRGGGATRGEAGRARREIDDLRARLAQLTNRVAQLEAENADMRRVASRVPFTSLARRVYRRVRSTAARRLRR